jgi:hypothetical protein
MTQGEHHQKSKSAAESENSPACWHERRDKQEKFKRLDDLMLENACGRDRTRVVVEMIAENEWGEKAFHYFFSVGIAA